jgi:hypothetical protein
MHLPNLAELTTSTVVVVVVADSGYSKTEICSLTGQRGTAMTWWRRNLNVGSEKRQIEKLKTSLVLKKLIILKFKYNCCC